MSTYRWTAIYIAFVLTIMLIMQLLTFLQDRT